MMRRKLSVPFRSVLRGSSQHRFSLRRLARHLPWRYALLVCIVALLSACYPIGNANVPLPTAFVGAPQPARKLVIFLPGRGDDLAGLKKSGIAQIIQRQWPDADVELVGLTMAYYTNGQSTRRLQNEVMVPALKRGYQEIWLAGTSLGGMGALTYDRDYPGVVYGMLLMAPYLGDGSISKEIVKAGGLAQWNPGPTEAVSPKTWQRELWRYLKGWSSDQGPVRHVWLAYGEHDRLRPDIELMSPSLRSSHVFVLPGGHSWKVWKAAMPKMLKAAAQEAAAGPAHRQNLQ